MSVRILILTAGYGEGHNAAARALAAACHPDLGVGAANVVDVFALSAPRLNTWVRRGYLGLINHAPRVWSMAYRWLDRSALFPRVLQGMHRDRRVLADVIERARPTAICCTFPAYAFMLQALRHEGRLAVPWFNVVTDSISINSLWWRAGATGWFLPNDDSADVLRRAGVDARRLHVTGFPVAPAFASHPGLEPPDIGRGATPSVLYILNSATRRASDLARRLLTDTPWAVTCTVGRDERLRHELERMGASRKAPFRILGWTEEIPRLLLTHHVVVSKAGGATTQEAIAARCPMIVNQIVPGQEEGNYELLRRHGIGALAQTPETVLAELHRAFDDGGRVWRQWRTAVTPLARPHAAREIANAVFAQVAAEHITEPVPIPFQPLAAPA